MNRLSHRPLLCLLAVLSGLAAARTSRAAEPVSVSAMQLLREGGCGGVLPPARPLQHIASLDKAAEQWAAGRSLTDAAERSGYQVHTAAGLHINGPASATIQLLKQEGCRTVANQAMRDVGVYQRGSNTWLVLASANVTPAASQAPILATRALQLVNEVRARGARCGERTFAPAPPVKLSEICSCAQAAAGAIASSAVAYSRIDRFAFINLSLRVRWRRSYSSRFRTRSLLLPQCWHWSRSPTRRSDRGCRNSGVGSPY